MSTQGRIETQYICKSEKTNKTYQKNAVITMSVIIKPCMAFFYFSLKAMYGFGSAIEQNGGAYKHNNDEISLKDLQYT